MFTISLVVSYLESGPLPQGQEYVIALGCPGKSGTVAWHQSSHTPYRQYPQTVLFPSYSKSNQ